MFKRFKRSHKGLFYRKKLAFTVTICLLFSLYFTLHFIASNIEIEYINTDKLNLCIEDRFKQFDEKLKNYDAFVLEDKLGTKNIPFVGNGNIGFSLSPSSGVYLRGKEFLSVLLLKNILVELNVEDYLSQSSHLIDFKDGILYKFSCFKHKDELCISSSNSMYAHRVYTELLVQTLKIHNPKHESISIEISINDNEIPGVILKSEKISLDSNMFELQIFMFNHGEYVFDHELNLHDNNKEGLDIINSNLTNTNTFNFRVPNLNEDLYILVGFLKPLIPDKLYLNPGETKTFVYSYGIKSAVNWFVLPKNKNFETYDPELKSKLFEQVVIIKEALIASLKKSTNVSEPELRSVHTKVWNRIWDSGFYISSSKAGNVLNGDRYNLTIYYLLSNVPDIISNEPFDSMIANEIHKVFNERSVCFDGPSTILTNSLWEPVIDQQSLLKLVDLWFVTLRKRGCMNFIHFGVQGMMQALLYSLASIRSSQGHLTMWLRLDSLHREIKFRNVKLVPSHVYIDFGVRYDQLHSPTDITHDFYLSRSQIKIRSPLLMHSNENDFLTGMALKESSDNVYGCPAQCDPIIVISTNYHSLPIYETNPPSALLHLSTKFTGGERSLIDFSRSQHHSDVQVAEGPRHDLINLHLHGHMLRGLPVLFWITLGFLVLLFHVFICRIVYSELWKGQDKADDYLPSPCGSDWTNQRRNPSHTWSSHSATMAGIFVNSHLANRRRQAQQFGYKDELP